MCVCVSLSFALIKTHNKTSQWPVVEPVDACVRCSKVSSVKNRVSDVEPAFPNHEKICSESSNLSEDDASNKSVLT